LYGTSLVAFAVADISGFTAWSSIRDAHQVFKLLESVFQAFDAIAKSYNVFKVETVGDSYLGTSASFDPDSDYGREYRSKISKVSAAHVFSLCVSLFLRTGIKRYVESHNQMNYMLW
jgi:class 3 adenylate cyclase